eukprot:1717361-Pleurochrysis_carterae.AAC.1
MELAANVLTLERAAVLGGNVYAAAAVMLNVQMHVRARERVRDTPPRAHSFGSGAQSSCVSVCVCVCVCVSVRVHTRMGARVRACFSRAAHKVDFGSVRDLHDQRASLASPRRHAACKPHETRASDLRRSHALLPKCHPRQSWTQVDACTYFDLPARGLPACCKCIHRAAWNSHFAKQPAALACYPRPLGLLPKRVLVCMLI